jgi:LmbE family N-acetylglucosaminyl deacetylase
MMQSRLPLFVISPHLDDAVLSCGALLAANPGAVVCTIFTAPPQENMSTDWDRQSGFADAFEAMPARRKEDHDALRLLGASPLHLPFCDAQYLSTPTQQDITVALRESLTQHTAARVLMPLGLFHSDHTLVSDACCALLATTRDIEFLAYEEVPYRHIKDAVPNRLDVLIRRGYLLEPEDSLAAANPVDTSHYDELKRDAIDTYTSQLRAFGPQGRPSLYSTEKYWAIRQG